MSSGTKRHSLFARYTATETGLHTLHIESTNSATASTCMFHYIDNISIVPAKPNFETDLLNIPCDTGATVNFTLAAGSGFAGKPYCVCMNFTDNYPGVTANGVTIPLNWDVLLQYSLLGLLPGTVNFVGDLDGSGNAFAQMALPADAQQLLVNLKLSFAYVVCAAGPSMPIEFASYPVHVKYIP